MKTKKCSNKTCDNPIKPLSQFSKDKNKMDGLQPRCKACVKDYNKQYRDNNKDEILKQHKEYNDKNKVKIAKYQKNYRDKNKEKLSKQDKEKYLKNKEKITKQHKKWRDNNKEKINKYFVDRRKIDINFKITGNLRNRLNVVLKGNTKSLPTMMLVGCEVDYLMYHLQCQFTKNMTWDNYGDGGWVVDHIKPCKSFDMSKPEEQSKCFNYKNLQPLWWIDNIKKGCKLLTKA